MSLDLPTFSTILTLMPERFTALIVDDERLARKELRSMLAEHPSVEVLGEAGSVEQASKLIRAQEPDVVFLDIQMPGESGFHLLECMRPTFKVIFVTAFDARLKSMLSTTCSSPSILRDWRKPSSDCRPRLRP
jgi:chemotaxis response regulator CheB